MRHLLETEVCVSAHPTADTLGVRPHEHMKHLPPNGKSCIMSSEHSVC